MFIKPIITLAIASTVSIFSFGQGLKSQFDIEKGPVFKIDKSESHIKVLPTEDGEFYSLQTGSKGTRKSITLVHFNNSLKITHENEIKLKFDKDKHEYEGLFYFNETLYLLTSNEDKESKQNKLYLHSINKKTLEPNGDGKVIASVSYEDYSKRNSGNFSVSFSGDRSKIMILQMLPYERTEKMKFSISILDATNNLDLLWGKTFVSENTNELEDIIDLRLTNEGEVITLLKQYKEKRTAKRKGVSNYNYEIQQIGNNGEDIKKVPIILRNEYITEMNLGLNDNDEIICTGFYSHEYNSGIKGCYFMLLDKEKNTVKKESKQEFSIDFLTDFMKEKKAEKTKKKKEKGKDVPLYNYDMSDIVIRDDGGVIQVAEQFYITTHTTTDANGNTTTRYVYHYNTLIVISISPEGEIEWSRKIPKQQASSSPYFASYFLEVINNNMYFFHVDNIKNLLAKDYGDLKGWSLGKNSILMATELNSEGFSQKDAIIDTKTDKTIVVPSVLVKNSKDEIIAFSRYKTKARYYRIKVNE